MPAQVINITLDQIPRTVNAGSSLADMLAQIENLPQAHATAVNGLFVPRTQRATCILNEGDSVVLFQPIVGG